MGFNVNKRFILVVYLWMYLAIRSAMCMCVPYQGHSVLVMGCGGGSHLFGSGPHACINGMQQSICSCLALQRLLLREVLCSHASRHHCTLVVSVSWNADVFQKNNASNHCQSCL